MEWPDAGGSVDHEESPEGASPTLYDSPQVSVPSYPTTDSAFSAPAHPDEDWTKVSDLSERRRIQNRIAQRNYRKKIKERMQLLEKKADPDGENREKAPAAYGDGQVKQQQAQHQRRRLSPEDHSFFPSPSPPASSAPPFSNNGLYAEGSRTTWIGTGDHPPKSEDFEPPANYGANSLGRQTDDVNLPNLDKEKTRVPLEEHPELPQIVENDKTVYGIQDHLPHDSISSSHQRYNGDGPTHAPPFRSTMLSSENATPELLMQRRPRTSRPKVKTGCNNCKQRRIKCGEERPACLNCVRSKKACSGYPPPPRSARPFEEIRIAPRLRQYAPPPSIDAQSTETQFPPRRATNHQRRDETSMLPNLEESPYRQPNAENDKSLLEEHLDCHSDDDTSIGSFTESVLDTGSLSNATSASSFRSDSHVMVAIFVDMLIRDKSMDSLLAMAITEFGLSSGRFTQNFSRILKSYSRHLQQAVEASSKEYDHKLRCLKAAKLIRNARYQISGLIATRHNERASTAQNFQQGNNKLFSRHSSQPLPADNNDPSSNEESSGDEADFSIGDLEDFLVSGEPYRHLKRSLRSRVTPDEFLHCIDESSREFINLTMADQRTKPFASNLRHVLTTRQDIALDLTIHIRAMATELKAECAGTPQMDVTIFLETYSQYIAVVAIDQAAEPSATHCQSAPEEAKSLSGKWSRRNVPEDVTGEPESLEKYDKNVRGVIDPEKYPSDWPEPPKLELFKKQAESANSNNTRVEKDDALPVMIKNQELLEDIVDSTLPLVPYVDLVPHLTFLSSSAAFTCFLDVLYDLVYPTFFSEAKKSVRSTIRSAEASEDRILALEGQRLLPTLSEMQSCLQQSDTRVYFTMSPDKTSIRVSDRLKLAIEASTAAEWDWWPLQPPHHNEDPGRAILSWHCSCGTNRQESTLPSYARELQTLYDNFPLSPGGSIAPIDRPSSSLSNTSSSKSARSSSTNVGGMQGTSSSASTTDSAVTIPDDGGDTLLNFGTGPRQYIYIFLLVRASEFVLDTINVNSMKARDFFQTLRAAYHQHRGLWRRVFSVFVYNHCDFIKIIRPEPDTFMPGEQRFELPSDHDDQYQYRPRPTYSAPVTKHMFRHYFYGCYDSDTIAHRFHTCLPLVPTCRIRNPAAELLDCFPKRDRKVATSAQSDKIEVCYGLVARECRSFFRVVVYLCLIMAPAFWFIFAWLFEFGNTSDLQDATVPITLMLTATSVLWAVVYSGSDVRKDYGDG